METQRFRVPFSHHDSQSPLKLQPQSIPQDDKRALRGPDSPKSTVTPNIPQDSKQPTHTVGSKERFDTPFGDLFSDTLLSAPENSFLTSPDSPKSSIPKKDADGKFPCPHCTKTYLHAKHLKRHLLRHTGVRPYMCVLCRDTFSRSDILKRHFQKCSIRRGNPTGEASLSHPSAQARKHQSAQAKPAAEGDMARINDIDPQEPSWKPPLSNNPQGSNIQGENAMYSSGMTPVDSGMANLSNGQDEDCTSEVSSSAEGGGGAPVTQHHYIEERSERTASESYVEISTKSENPCSREQFGCSSDPSRTKTPAPRTPVLESGASVIRRKKPAVQVLYEAHTLNTAFLGDRDSRSPEMEHFESSPTPSCSTSDSSLNSNAMDWEAHVAQKKKQMIENVISFFIRGILLKFDQARGHTRTTIDGTGASSSTSTSASKVQGGGKARKPMAKRIRGEEDRNGKKDEEDESEEESDGSRQRSSKGKGVATSKLACPYFKYDTAKYAAWPQCCGPGWDSTHRIKEHLYRRHRQPKYRCQRCWQPFKDEATMVSHQRSTSPCPLQDMEPVDGFDANQESLLRKRKKAMAGASEAEKWREVYKILFPHIPDEEIPLPYYDHSREAAEGSDRLDEFERFLLREMPPRLKRSLEQDLEADLNIVEESLKKKALEYFTNFQIELIHEFRQHHQLPTSPNEGKSSPSAAAAAAAAAAAGSSGEDDAHSDGLNLNTSLPGEVDQGGVSLRAEEFNITLPEMEALDRLLLGSEALSPGFSDPFWMLGDPDLGMDGGGLLGHILSHKPGDGSHVEITGPPVHI